MIFQHLTMIHVHIFSSLFVLNFDAFNRTIGNFFLSEKKIFYFILSRVAFSSSKPGQTHSLITRTHTNGSSESSYEWKMLKVISSKWCWTIHPIFLRFFHSFAHYERNENKSTHFEWFRMCFRWFENYPSKLNGCRSINGLQNKWKSLANWTYRFYGFHSESHASHMHKTGSLMPANVCEVYACSVERRTLCERFHFKVNFSIELSFFLQRFTENVFEFQWNNLFFVQAKKSRSIRCSIHH